MTQTAIQQLHATLARRDTPEQVAEIIDRHLPPTGILKIRRLIRHMLSKSQRSRFGWSSMPTRFKPPVPMNRQLAKAHELALLFLGRRIAAADDPDALEAFVAEFGRLIGRTPAQRSFRDDRANREQRAALGLSLSRRRYDKLFRLTVRLDLRLEKLREEEARHRLMLVSKAALGSQLAISDFGDHLPSVAFVAYYSARMKLRSEFTIDGQQRPFDDLAADLLGLCRKDSDNAAWWAIAHVFPRADVLAHLDDRQKGMLLGRWQSILTDLADRLEQAWQRTDIQLDTMIVKRGNDSSTWNLFAAAWNRARDHWLALIDAMGLHAMFDVMLPGKVMRLMAADVAYWHRSSGGAVHPDTLVWRALPKPWDVLRGNAISTRTDVERLCREHGIDPAKSGWSAPRARTAIAEFRPTPELVHGVAVDNPYLAAMLKRAGVYSGKALRLDQIETIVRG